MLNLEKIRFIAKELVLPILVFVGLVTFFSNIQYIPYEFDEKNSLIVRYLAKIIGTIIFPLALIYLLHKNKTDFGIYFPKFSDSFKLSIRAYSIGGPAGIIWLIIGFLGWGFKDWSGAITLSVVYLVVFYFVPKVTNKLPTRNNISIPNNRIKVFVTLSLVTVAIALEASQKLLKLERWSPDGQELHIEEFNFNPSVIEPTKRRWHDELRRWRLYSDVGKHWSREARSWIFSCGLTAKRRLTPISFSPANRHHEAF